MNRISEKEIIERVLDGDANAFEELVLRYEKTVYSLAVRMVSDREDAADMTQEACITACPHSEATADFPCGFTG